MTHLDIYDNAECLGTHLLVILLWVGVYGAVETLIEWYTPSERIHFMVYLVIALVTGITFLFIHHP
jgi:hypothetical protein